MNARKKSSLARLSQTVVLTLSALTANAAEISGYILDYDTAEPVADAQLEINGQLISIDEEGYFSVDVDSSQITASVSAPGYEGSSKTIAAVDGQINNLSMSLMSANRVEDDDEYETSEVIGRYVPPSAAANERDAKAVLDSIGAEELSRSGDSDVASALKRVVGLNLRGGSYVSIRGLDGRYIASTFNGANMPSLNSVRREVPLDVIPSGILNGIDVQKGFSSDLSGLSTGGTVKLSTKTYPLKPVANYSIGLGYNSTVFNSDFKTREQGGLDYFGYDDGLRAIPSNLDAATADKELQVQGKSVRPEYTQSEVDELFGKQMPVNYEFQDYQVNPDLSLGLTLGNGYQSSSKAWDYGFLTSFSFKNKNSVQADGQKQQYEDAGSPQPSFASEYDQYKRTVNLSGMLSMGVTYHDYDTLTFNSLLTRKTEERNSIERVNLNDPTEDIVDYSEEYNSQWQERTFFINQILGEHFYDEGSIKWGITSFSGEEYSPDEMSYFYFKRFSSELPELDPSINRSWFELTDDTMDYYLDYNQPFTLWDHPFDMTVGASMFDKERDTIKKDFIIQWRDSDTEPLTRTDLNNVFSADKFGDEIILADNSDLSGRYNGTHDEFAYYGKFSSTAWNDFLEYEVGLRSEVGDINVESSTANNPSVRRFAEVSYNDLLPALSLNFALADDLLLKTSYSQTAARPSMRELSVSSYRDDDFGLLLQGNPELKASSITNYDVRAEYYFSESENISIALFMKEFDDPIQRVARPSVAATKFDFENQESGQLTGIEMDFRKEFIFDLGNKHNFYVSGNFAFIDSEVTLTSLAAQKTGSNKQQFQGQPDYVANLQLGYDELLSQQSITLLYSLTSEQIFAPAESDNIGPIVEEEFDQLDINYSWKAFEHLTLKAAAKNILDEEKLLTQDGRTFRKYKSGTEFTIGLSGSF